jgi:hypothetical protein
MSSRPLLGKDGAVRDYIVVEANVNESFREQDETCIEQEKKRKTK